MTEQPAHRPPEPFRAAFEGWTPDPEDLEQWSNTVSVEAVEGYDTTFTGDPAEADVKYADFGEVRQLVEIDTNYKSTRQGEHPVRLTRADALRLAAGVLQATGNTFHAIRCGSLRAGEAAELLDTLRAVEVQLDNLREHALDDLLHDTGYWPDGTRMDDEDDAVTSEPEQPAPAADEGEPSEELEQQFTHALGDMFRDALLFEISSSDAYGALKYKVLQRCQTTGETPAQVLNSISWADRSFAAEANDPAAFLTSRVTTD